MSFNPDLSNEATKVFFPRKGNEDSPFPPRFNDNPIETAKVHISISITKYINAAKY